MAASLSSVAQEGAGLRLRLRFEEDAADLATLPWETLYDPGQGHFVGLGEQSPILRYLSLPRSRSALLVEPPLRVLAVLSSPAGLPPLDMDREWQAIQDALAGLTADGKFVLERLATPSLAALQERLLGEPVHILHFVGHGVFDEGSQAGSLALEDASGRPNWCGASNWPHCCATILPCAWPTSTPAKARWPPGSRSLPAWPRPWCGRACPQPWPCRRRSATAAPSSWPARFYTALAAGRPVDAALTQAPGGPQRRRQPGVGHPRALQPLAGQPPLRHPPGAAHARLPLPRHGALHRGAEGPVLWPGQGDRGRGGAPAPASLPGRGGTIGQRQVVADLRRRHPSPAHLAALWAGGVDNAHHAAQRQPHA